MWETQKCHSFPSSEKWGNVFILLTEWQLVRGTWLIKNKYLHDKEQKVPRKREKLVNIFAGRDFIEGLWEMTLTVGYVLNQAQTKGSLHIFLYKKPKQMSVERIQPK